jgi:urease accessory protein
MTAFLGGLLHPVMVPAHAMTLLALGLLLAQQRRRGVAMIAFTVALVAGIGALVAAVGETPAMTVLLIAAGVTGLLVALAWPLPLWMVVPLAAAIGAAIGLDSPPQEISFSAAIVALIGTAIAAIAIVTLIAFAGARLTRPWQRIGVRIVGSWTAASAVLVLALWSVW